MIEIAQFYVNRGGLAARPLELPWPALAIAILASPGSVDCYRACSLSRSTLPQEVQIDIASAGHRNSGGCPRAPPNCHRNVRFSMGAVSHTGAQDRKRGRIMASGGTVPQQGWGIASLIQMNLQKLMVPKFTGRGFLMHSGILLFLFFPLLHFPRRRFFSQISSKE